jgi:hypothetical protein
MITPEMNQVQQRFNLHMSLYVESRGWICRDMVIEAAAALWNLSWDVASRRVERDFWRMR